MRACTSSPWANRCTTFLRWSVQEAVQSPRQCGCHHRCRLIRRLLRECEQLKNCVHHVSFFLWWYLSSCMFVHHIVHHLLSSSAITNPRRSSLSASSYILIRQCHSPSIIISIRDAHHPSSPSSSSGNFISIVHGHHAVCMTCATVILPSRVFIFFHDSHPRSSSPSCISTRQQPFSSRTYTSICHDPIFSVTIIIPRHVEHLLCVLPMWHDHPTRSSSLPV